MDLLQDAVKAACLARMQIELEYQLDSRDRLVPFLSSEEQARYIVYRFNAGHLCWYRHDLDEAMVTAIAASPAEWAFEQPERILAIMTGEPVPDRIITPCFVSGYLPCCPDPTEFQDVEYEPGEGFVLRQDNQIVARAFSVRKNARSSEVAVETDSAYRRRGYARQVTAAWVQHVILEGRQAFYSYKADNFASAALAASLGVVIFAEVVGFD